MPWPEEKQHRKVNPLLIRANFKHAIVIGGKPQDGTLQREAVGGQRFAVRIRFRHAAPAANAGNEIDDSAPEKGEDDEKTENDQGSGYDFVIHDEKDSVITAVCKPFDLKSLGLENGRIPHKQPVTLPSRYPAKVMFNQLVNGNYLKGVCHGYRDEF